MSGKKSLRYFRHIFDKLKPIFIIFGKSRPEYSPYSTVEIFSLQIAMSLCTADVIMTSSKMPLSLYQRWKMLTLFWLITLTKLNMFIIFL